MVQSQLKTVWQWIKKLNIELPYDRGMGWRGKREGGSGWGTHVNPWLIHVNVWQKPLEYCKVISLQLIKINEKIIYFKSKWLPDWIMIL